MKNRSVLKYIKYSCALTAFAVITFYVFSNTIQRDYIKNTSAVKVILETVESTFNLYQKDTKKTGPPIKIIIHTYMRSGSSFTAELLAMHPNIFYLFEPLHTLQNIMDNVKIPYFPYLNKPARIKQEVETASHFNTLLKYDILDNYLQCEMSKIDLFTLQAPFLLLGNQRTKDYKKCLQDNSNTMGVVSCLPIFHNTCSQSKAILIKTIRSDMSYYRQMLKEHQTLKIIHLVRDPRATLYSELLTGGIQMSDWISNSTNVAERFCTRVLNDFKIGQELETLYPGRLKVVMYEDIATDPIKRSFELHRFVGIEFTEEEKRKVLDKTSTGKISCTDNMCTHKANSTLAASKWRETVLIKDVKVIDQVCGPLLYDIFGLNYIPSIQKLRNKNYSLRTSDAIFTVLRNKTRKH